MFSSLKNYYFIIASCLFSIVLYLSFEYYFTKGKMGVPLDDTWIHFQFADNFAKGFFFQYNVGEPTAGTTSPLYVIVLALTSFVIKNFIVNSIFLSSFFHLLSCIFIFKISLTIFQNQYSPLKNFNSEKFTPQFLSLLVALLTIFTGRFAWSALSGMETTMFTFFCIAGIYFHIKNLRQQKFNLLPTLFISLATVSRPEGFLLFGLYLFDVILNLIREKAFKKNLLNFIFSILIFSFVTFPYLIFSYNISHHFFPNTFQGQGGGFKFIPDIEYLWISFKHFFNDNPIISLLYLFSFIFYFANRKKYFPGFRLVNLIFLWIIFLPIVLSFTIPNWRHHVRYLIPLIPFINFAAIYFPFNLLNKNYFSRVKEFFLKKKFVLPSILIFSLIYYVVFAIALGRNIDNINEQQVKLGKWIKENISPNETIALNDIGAITFISKNKIIDMAGLVTPEVLRFKDFDMNIKIDSMNYLLKKNNVKYIIVYDDWYKEFLDFNKNNLTFITSAYLEDNTICGGDEMKVYKINF